MRTIQGGEMYIFEKNDIIQDLTYKGGKKNAAVVVLTNVRQQQPRPGKDQDPTIKIKLNKQGIEALRTNSPG